MNVWSKVNPGGAILINQTPHRYFPKERHSTGLWFLNFADAPVRPGTESVTLYLFGRRQDIGFQKAIDNSPRRRHHVRFWALSLQRTEAILGKISFWFNDDRPKDQGEVFWVGAGTKDIGFSFTRLTFQVTHATDSDTNAERNFIIAPRRRASPAP